MIHRWFLTELQGGLDLPGAVATGHLHAPHLWVFPEEDDGDVWGNNLIAIMVFQPILQFSMLSLWAELFTSKKSL